MRIGTKRQMIITSITLAILALNWARSQVKENQEDLASKADDFVTALVEANEFSGAILVAHEGDVIISQGYNMANREHGIPNTPETKFRLGSITKQFTAMAAMILQEKGKLHVHDSVCKYVEDCPESWQGVTIHHLMTHSSGIPNFQYFPDNLRYERLPTTVEKTIERFKHENLYFDPGAEFRYCSSGYVLLGYIMERVTGLAYEAIVNQYIFEPLGMKDTGYDHPRTILANRADGYSSEEGRLLNAIHFEMDTPYSAGALYSTVEDLFLWDQSLYTTQLVSSGTINTIFAPHVPIADYGYGYGWRVRRLFDRELRDHNGVISGFKSNYYRFPEEKVCIITLSNFEFANLSRINRHLSALVFDVKENSAD